MDESYTRTMAHVLGITHRRVYGELTSCLHQVRKRVKWQQRLHELSRWLTCNFTINASAVVDQAQKLGM